MYNCFIPEWGPDFLIFVWGMFDLLIGLGHDALFAWGTGSTAAGEEWATFLLWQGVGSPGWSRRGKGHCNDTWPEALGFNLLEGDLKALTRPFFLFFSFFFLRLHLQHTEVPRPGVGRELQLPADATASATWGSSCISNKLRNSRQPCILNPQSGARN